MRLYYNIIPIVHNIGSGIPDIAHYTYNKICSNTFVFGDLSEREPHIQNTKKYCVLCFLCDTRHINIRVNYLTLVLNNNCALLQQLLCWQQSKHPVLLFYAKCLLGEKLECLVFFGFHFTVFCFKMQLLTNKCVLFSVSLILFIVCGVNGRSMTVEEKIRDDPDLSEVCVLHFLLADFNSKVNFVT